MRTWKRKGRGDAVRIVSQLDAHEAELLASLVSSMCELLAERAETAPRDPLSEMTGIRTGHSAPPDDVTLGRLLPDFHRPDQDEELSAEVVNGRLNSALRSVNEPKIIDAKMSAAHVLLDTLPDGGGDLALTVDQAEAWLTALNDVRLALGAMLGISEDTPDQLPPGHPHAAHLDVYHWLTVMQDLLVEAVM
ncbi:oxidative stress transcriptional regulator AosR [Gordonia aurantiaca]|uniref:oxidative stress transcriptional regulator AosR n=1 Tax=Gordonia sp. B21 TaxID=3151852 RepID=UPI003263F145